MFCAKLGDCCDDFKELCGADVELVNDGKEQDLGPFDASARSCEGVCGPYVPGALSQCDVKCLEEGDCCADHSAFCMCNNDADCKLDLPCSYRLCDLSVNLCKPATSTAGGPCDDGDACTEDDCDPKDGACIHAPAKCDDGDDCTADSCSKQHCQHGPAADGIACDDGDGCTKGELCTAGACVAGATRDCGDDNPCTMDHCDPDTGECGREEAGDGSLCDDDDACTAGDNCQAGVCAGVHKNCSDGKPCTSDTCDKATGNCSHAPAPPGMVCGPGLTCSSGCKPSVARLSTSATAQRRCSRHWTRPPV